MTSTGYASQRRPQRCRVAPALHRLALGLAALILVGACASVGVSARFPAGPARVHVGFFFDELSPYGDWLWVDDWGWAWRPWHVGVGWVPYSHGRWVYTDQGWSWISFWPWGWAPFHYGRWGCDPRHGWIWVPGTVWAPAWVSWRHGPGWIGWAPLPPGADWDARDGLRRPHREIERHAWSFIPARDLVNARLDDRILPRARNATLLERTVESTRFEPSGGAAVERGLDPGIVERELGRRLERRPVEEMSAPPRDGRDSVARDAVRLYRPRVEPAPLPDPPTSTATVAPEPRVVERQRRELSQWAETERRRLERIHATERRGPPPEVAGDRLDHRQDTERDALRQEVERRQRWIESERPAARPKPKKPPESPAPRRERR